MRSAFTAAILIAATAAASAQDQPKPATPAPAPSKAKPEPPWQDFCCYEKGRIEHGELVTVIYEINHAGTPQKPQGLEDYAKLLTPFLTKEKGRVDSSNQLGTLTLTDTKQNLPLLEKLLQTIHQPDAPVLIEARVVELRWGKGLQIGIDGDLGSGMLWTKNGESDAAFRDFRMSVPPRDAVPPPFEGSAFRFNSLSHHKGTVGALVQMFVERGQAQILSQPRILVKAEQTATIFAGDEIAIPNNLVIQPAGTQITFSYRPIGVSLEVTPQLVAPGQVSLKIKPEVSGTFGFQEISPTVSAPTFTVRRAMTELIVRDGEEVVIGGLYRRDKITIRRGIPFLVDIPLLGYLFGKYEEDEIVQEIIFFIKPRVIKSEEDMPRGMIVPERK